MKNLKGIVSVFVLIILALVVVGGVGYYAYKNGQINLIPRSGLSKFPPLTLSPTPSIKALPSHTPSETSLCDCSWAISSSTNIEFLVTSPSGEQTGYLQGTKTYVQNIPDSSYGIESGIADDTGQNLPLPDSLYFGLNNSENGIYLLEVTVKQSGKYHLDIGIAWGPMNSKSIPVDGALMANQVDKYELIFPEGAIQKIN